MENIIRFTEADLLKYTVQRSGEIKFGERVQTVPKDADVIEFIKASEATFVLLGIPEDIGLRANFCRPGASLAWQSTVKSIVNVQHNKFCKGGNLLILGHVDVTAMQETAQNTDATTKEGRRELSNLVEKLDKDVSHIVCQIIKAGKTPIIIGGGHNNAYGTIKGTALAKGRPVNAINYDTRANFRMLGVRHSANGFSYAFEEGFLKNYFAFGLHENYISKWVIDSIKKYTERIRFNTYEQIAVRKEKHFSEEMALATGFIADEPFGLELSLDALPNVASSDITNTGFSVEKARQFIDYFGQQKNVAYLHITDGAPDPDNDFSNNITGKLITYLVTDFMKAKKIV